MQKILVLFIIIACCINPCGLTEAISDYYEEPVEELNDFELEDDNSDISSEKIIESNVSNNESQIIVSNSYIYHSYQVEFEETKIILGVGETYTPTFYTDAPYWSIDFYSKNNKIATIDDYGVIRAKKKGTTTIYLTTAFGPTASIKVQVKNKPTKISLPSTYNMHVDELARAKIKLSSNSASHISWENNNEAVGIMLDSTYFYALKPGIAKVTASTYNGKKATCTIHVYKWPTQIYINPYISIKRGKTINIIPTFKTNEWDKYTIRSLNNKIAKVSGNKITGKKKGTTFITMTTTNGVRTSAIINVY